MSTSPARLVEVFKPACVQSYRGHRHHTPIWATRQTYVRNCQLSVLGTCPLECLGQVRFLYMCVRTFLKFCSHTGPTDAIHVCTSRYRTISFVQNFFLCGRFVRTQGHRHCCAECRLGIGHGRRCDDYEAYLSQTEIYELEVPRRMQDPSVMTRSAVLRDTPMRDFDAAQYPDRISDVVFQGTVLGPSQESRQGAAESRSRSRERSSGICSICRDPLGGKLVLLPCRHIFHMKCAHDWGRIGHACCALCREPYIATHDELRKMRVYH